MPELTERRDGGQEGPIAEFDAKRRQWFHLNRLGDRAYHEVPLGFAFDEKGASHPAAEKAEAQTAAPEKKTEKNDG